ncbi:MAG TPA: 3-hydroxyacyl-ACP dehydratase FabZ [Fimbriimonadaceae bacterium]|nr:3-hydroxyacyl-ACP dehydratase FabZ [Fimbriimonadaceae bacterium]
MKLDIKAILDILPHRYPMLLVDRAEIVEPGKRITGHKCVTINEPFFVGHYPGEPIMPGVMIVEAGAQCGALLFLSQEEHKGKIPLIGGIDHIKFRRPVRPGDVLMFDVELDWMRGPVGKCHGVATVDGQPVCSFEMSFKLESKEQAPSE